MQLCLDAGQQILLVHAEIWAKRLKSDQFRPNFLAGGPAPARVNILWLRIQSNKPFGKSIRLEVFSKLDKVGRIIERIIEYVYNSSEIK